MNKKLRTIAIIAACLLSSMTFATSYHAIGNVVIQDQYWYSGCGWTYTIEVGVATEYTSWTGWIPWGQPFQMSVNPDIVPVDQLMPAIPYENPPQSTTYYRVYFRVTRHVGLNNTVSTPNWAYGSDTFNGNDYFITANKDVEIKF